MLITTPTEEDVTGRVEEEEFGVVVVSTELTVSTVPTVPTVSTAAVLLLLLLVLRVVTAAPFKLFIRAEALLRGVGNRFLSGVASTDVGLTLDLLVVVVVLVMLAGGVVDTKVDTPVSVVMDAPCDSDPLLLLLVAEEEVVLAGSAREEEAVQPRDVTVLSRLELMSWRISGLYRRPWCCCCSSVVVVTAGAAGAAGSGFPK